MLEALQRHADDRRDEPGDSKAHRLIEWLRECLMPDGRWNGQRVILFTEYRATQKWLMERLAFSGFGEHGRILQMYGGMHSEEREAVKNAFQAQPGRCGSTHPARDRFRFGRPRSAEPLPSAGSH